MALDQGRNGATLSASEMLVKRPSSLIGIFAADDSTNTFVLGDAQYPVLPGGGPNLIFPSGQRGAGVAGAAARRGAGVNNRFPVRVTDFAEACLASLLAGRPSTATVSPICNVLRFQPSRSSSIGLPISTAQFATVPVASRTSRKKNALGVT